MGVISIEFAEPVEDPEPCPCCGGRTTRLTRFVYSDGNAHAIYYAQYSNNHPHKWVSALVSLCEWSEDITPSDRVAFAVRIRSTENEYQVSIVDAAESPWSHVTLLGRMLDRKEALKHKWKEEMFHITDHMVEDDPDIRGYFATD